MIVRVGIAVGSVVAIGESVGVRVFVIVEVAVCVGVRDAVLVRVRVGVFVAVADCVGVRVAVGVAVGDAVAAPTRRRRLSGSGRVALPSCTISSPLYSWRLVSAGMVIVRFTV